MPLNHPQNQRLVKPGILVETTQGTLETGADYQQLAVESVDVSGSSSVERFINTGELAPTQAFVVSESVSGNIPFTWLFNSPGLWTMLAAAMRDSARPAEVSAAVTGVDYELAGTHQDGTTGERLIARASTTAFDALSAASSNGLPGLALKITGAANNNSSAVGEKVCKGAPYDDATDSFIDMDPRYFNAASGWGSAWTADTAESITIDAGGALVAYATTTPGGNNTYSIVGQFADLTDKWMQLTGCAFGYPSLSISGRGMVSGTVPMVAEDWLGLVTNPITPNVIDGTNVFLEKPMYGGRHSTRIVIVTDTQTIVLTSGVVNNLTIEPGGTVTAIEDTQGGISPAGYLWGSMGEPSISFTYYVNDSAEVAALLALQQDPGREQAGFQLWLTDEDGNQLAFTFADGEPDFAVTKIGAGSDEAATVDFTLHNFERTGIRPVFAVQYWTA